MRKVLGFLIIFIYLAYVNAHIPQKNHNTLFIKKSHGQNTKKTHIQATNLRKSEKHNLAEKISSKNPDPPNIEYKDLPVEKLLVVYKELSEECREEVNIFCKNGLKCGRPQKRKHASPVCCLGINTFCSDDRDCCYGSACMGTCYVHLK